MGITTNRHPLCVAIGLLLAVAPPAAHAAWQPDGTPLSPAAAALETYSLRGLSPDGAGGALAVWEFTHTFPDFSNTTHTYAAQRVDLLGDRPAPWGVNGTTFRTWLDASPTGTFSLEALPIRGDGGTGAILPVIDHGFVVEDVNQFKLYHVVPGGTVTPIPPFGDLPGLLVYGAAADADGAAGIVMIGIRQTFAPPPGPAPPPPLFVQRIDPSGTLLWPVGVTAPGPELVPAGQAQVGAGLAALSDGAGGAFYAWTDRRDVADPDLYVQRVDATGAVAAGWPTGGVQVCGATGSQTEAHLVSDGAGGAIALWRDERDGTSRLYATHVLPTGAIVPGIPVDGRQLPSGGTDDRIAEMVSDGANGCFVVLATTTPSLVGISHLHRLDGALQPRAGWPPDGIALNTMSPASGFVGVVDDGSGGAFVSYRNGFGSAAPQGLFAQHFAGDGTPAPGWTAAGVQLSGTGLDSRIVRSGSGAIVAWNDFRTGGNGIYAQRLVPDGPVAIAIALVSASADAGSVTLRWFAADAAGLRVTLERRTDDSEWSRLAELSADGAGALAYADRDVTPGARYGYRLRWQEGPTPQTSAEAWVDVPRAFRLALETPRPNPVLAGAMRVALTLPDDRGARLEVIDLAGRRVAARDLAGLGAGRHEVSFDGPVLAPGIYTLRLAQGATTLHARVCVVR